MKSKLFKLSLIAALCAAFTLTSCEKPTPEPEPDPDKQEEQKPDEQEPAEPGETTLEITSDDTLKVAIGGGAYEIAYTLTNPSDSIKLEVEIPEGINWITDINTDTEGKITFNVASNEGNKPREAEISVKYDFIVQKVLVSQEGYVSPYDYEYEMTVFTGWYYGAANDGEAANYYAYLSDKEFVEDFAMMPEGTYFRLDLFAPVSETDNIFIAEGTYVYDLENTKKIGTFTTNSVMMKTGAGFMEGQSSEFEEGTLVITKDGDKWNYDLKVTIEGESYHVTYNGPVAFIDETEEPVGEDDEWVPPTGEYDKIEENTVLVPQSAKAYYTNPSDEGGNMAIEFTQDNKTLTLAFYYPYTDEILRPGKYTASGTRKEGTLEYGNALISLFGTYGDGSYLAVEVDDPSSIFGGTKDILGLVSGGYVEITDAGSGQLKFDFHLEIGGEYTLTGTYTTTTTILPDSYGE